ncbi:MAG: hypothetical protein IJP54_01090 [Synergistaceae bacterium]|nr:hypothetical protein [Synergistaceae bacterium]MBR0034246.1 hypothetical protein [Synergistaceae bacterium]
MKRRAFILTEILTGMMLQVMFAVVLCSAFYMILNFSTSAQQGFAANDKGQMVIAYFDSRIRNAGLGMWKCHGSADVRASLVSITALQDTNLCLPVAIVSSDDNGHETVSHDISHDNRTGVYSGNVVTLLYAHKDTNEITSESGNPPVRLILITDNLQSKTVTNAERSTRNNFQLIDNKGNYNISSYTSSNFFKGGNNENIRNYAVMESSGIPVYTSYNRRADNSDWVNLQAPSAAGVTVYPMSEMLNLECQKLYVRKDANGYNFVFQELNSSGSWGKFYYHTKDILDLYMTLDTRPAVPIFELRVLVSEGFNEQGTTTKPKDWPGRWKNTGFDQYKVHVSKAAWKLYNLVPQFH